MSYQTNKYFEKYNTQHDDLRKSVRFLERFCRDENCDLHYFGSTTRSDYYHGQSDCYVIIACDNIDNAIAKIEYLIDNNMNITSTNKKNYYIKNIPHVDTSCSPVILYNLKIYDLPYDLNFLRKQDFGNKNQIVNHISSPCKDI